MEKKGPMVSIVAKELRDKGRELGKARDSSTPAAMAGGIARSSRSDGDQER